MYDVADTLEGIQTKKEEFWTYITDEVNPYRASIGLAHMTRKVADECFGIIYDFERKNEEKRALRSAEKA